MTISYDTVPSEDLLQAVNDYSPECVPVKVEGVVHTEEMPTETVYQRFVLPIAGDPVKILNADPRRKKATIFFFVADGASSAGTDFVNIGSTSGQVRAFTGAMLTTPNATSRYDSTDKNEVWARPGNCTAAGAFVASTEVLVMSLVIELWSR